MILLILFFIIPMGYLLFYSFAKYDPARLVVPEFTLENYIQFFGDSYVREMIYRTFKVAGITSLITLLIGYPLAYYMRLARGTEKTIFAIIVLTPMMISHIILGYSWMLLLSPESGLINVTLKALGFISQPLQLLSTETGVIVALVHFTLVYMVLNLHSALEGIDELHLRAASMLGAKPLHVFIRVIFPLSLPGVFSGLMLVFAVSSSALMVPLLVVGRQVPLLSVYVYDLNSHVLNWPMGATAGIALLIISLIPIFVFSSIQTKLRKRLGMER